MFLEVISLILLLLKKFIAGFRSSFHDNITAKSGEWEQKIKYHLI